MMHTFEIPDGYSRTKRPRMVRVRRMELAEIKALQAGQHAECISDDGKLRTVKINGAVKTWKTRPEEVEVSIKYGMYEYARFNTTDALTRFVVRVPEPEPAV